MTHSMTGDQVQYITLRRGRKRDSRRGAQSARPRRARGMDRRRRDAESATMPRLAVPQEQRQQQQDNERRDHNRHPDFPPRNRRLPRHAPRLPVGQKAEHPILIAISHDPDGHEHRLATQIGEPHVHFDIPCGAGNLLPAGVGLELVEALVGQRAGIFSRNRESLVGRVFQVDFVRRHGQREIERAKRRRLDRSERPAGPHEQPAVAPFMLPGNRIPARRGAGGVWLVSAVQKVCVLPSKTQ